MSQQLQQTRYDQLIRRAGGLIGGGSKVSSVIPELFPVLELENTTPELLILSGWRLAWQQIDQAAVVGQVSKVQLANPLGSGIIAAVTHLSIRTDTNENVQMEVTDTLLVSALIRGLFRDGRLGGDRSTTCELRSDSNLPTGGGLRLFIPANTETTVSDDNGLCVLPPGTALDVGTVNVNIFASVNFFWRERTAEASELSFP